MAHDQTRNHWWRFVPRSRGVGVLAVVASAGILVTTISLLVSHTYTQPMAIGYQVVFAVLAAWNLLRSITGLAAYGRQ